MNNIRVESHPFEPFLPSGAVVLMLGTFPPKPERWSMEFYYPNKINDMWRIMGLIFYGDKNHFWIDEEKRFDLPKLKAFLTERKIALYDTATRVRLQAAAHDSCYCHRWREGHRRDIHDGWRSASQDRRGGALLVPWP